MTTLGIALGGALGALARAAVAAAVTSRAGRQLPWGTAAVNLTGCLALGLVAGAGGNDVLGAGFLGAYTTFSTWSVQTVALLEEGEWRAAAVNVVGSLGAGTALAAAGLALA